LTESVVDFEVAAKEVAAAIDDSVGKAVEGQERVAVAFSGGLDSSVVAACAKKHADVLACTAYVKGAGDEAKSRRAAASLGVDLAEAEVTAEVAAAALKSISLPFEPTLMDRSLWCLYSAVARRAHGSGARVLLLGQLADELFGGYAKYAEELSAIGDQSARRMMRADYLEYAVRGRVRDFGACSPWVEPRLPLGAKELEDLAASLPTSYLIRDGVRKAVLRRAAVIVGVPEEQAMAPKKAAQYSSGVQKLLSALRF